MIKLMLCVSLNHLQLHAQNFYFYIAYRVCMYIYIYTHT